MRAALGLLGLGSLALVSEVAAKIYNTEAAPEAYSDTVLNVHIVPHTHDDVGWLKTVDQYYYGANNSIQHAGVRFILDSTIPELEKDPKRRFTYVEMAFFARWFYDQTPALQERVRRLVKRGQLDFVNGGWCMHDEATTHYVAMVDQTTLGHEFLRREFDFKPRVGWQIDPFGHSSTQAALLSYEAGFDALFFGRIDYQDREARQATRECEGVWRASPSAGPENQVFWGLTGSYDGNYGPPSGYNFDMFNENAVPVMDDKYMQDYNVPSRVEGIVQAALSQAKQTKGNHIMMTMGLDFMYEASAEWYVNLDKLIHYTNLDGRVKLFYSTPTKYMEAKHAEGTTWAVKTDDFFPYADAANAYWTGFFSSRPSLKRYERVTSGYLQAARQLEALSGQGRAEGKVSALLALEAAQGIAQHHDGVSGTAKQHVTFDYALRLANGESKADEVVTQAMEVLAPGVEAGTLARCPLLNVSVCPIAVEASSAGSGSALTVVAYNPLARTRREVLRIPVQQAPVAVERVGTQSVSLPFDVVPAAASPAGANAAPLEVVFSTGDLAPLETSTFELSFGEGNPEASEQDAHVEEVELVPGSSDVFRVSNDLVTLAFSRATGRLVSMAAAEEEIAVDLDQGFFYYTSFNSTPPAANRDAAVAEGMDLGDCDPATWEGCPMDDLYVRNPDLVRRVKDFHARRLSALDLHRDLGNLRIADIQNSGAYIFRPSTPDMAPIPVGADDQGAAEAVQVLRGSQVIEVRQRFSSWLNQTIRLYPGDETVELEWTVGAIPTGDELGKEVVSRFSSSVASGNSFSTDSNGREFLERKRGFRPSWEVSIKEPVAGNYYPVNMGTYLRDSDAQLSVLTDRTQGAASLKSGDLELMVHRRTLLDDSRGVGEPLNETSFITSYADTDCTACREGEALVARGTHYLQLSRPGCATRHLRNQAQRVFSPVVTSFAASTPTASGASSGPRGAVESPRAASRKESSPRDILPPNVQLVTLQTVGQGELLVRLEHFYAVGEDPVLSRPVAVNVTEFMTALGFQPESATELTLTANQLRHKLNHLDWNTASADGSSSSSAGIAPRVEGGDESHVDLAHGEVLLTPMQIRTLLVKYTTDRQQAHLQGGF